MSRDDNPPKQGDMLHLPPLSDADWPADIADMATGFAGGLNVYRTMAHHQSLLRAWADIREHVANQTSLGPERSEVVILCTGMRLGSSYEWSQHIERARAQGFSDVRIAALKGPLEDIAPEDRPLAAAVDELFQCAQLSDATCRAIAALVGKSGVLDLMATVGFYTTLGFILNTFETPLEAEIRARLDANPLRDGSSDTDTA